MPFLGYFDLLIVVFGHKDTLFSSKSIRFIGKYYLKKIPSELFGWDFSYFTPFLSLFRVNLDNILSSHDC